MLRRELDEFLHKPEEQRHRAKQQRLSQEVHEPMARKAPTDREGFDEENRLGDDERTDRRRRGSERAATEVAERDRLGEGDHVKQAQKQDRRRHDLAYL